ncbi:major facilitator superfamily domain-containing protein [Scleroderma yunnanense]
MTVDENTPLILKKSKLKTPLPKFQLSLVLLLMFAEPISAQYIFPFINQLIRELDITGGDDRKIGYYAGLIVSRNICSCGTKSRDYGPTRGVHSLPFDPQESLFFIAQALTTLHWSRLSDHVGRKPVLLIGLVGLSISNVCFGLSTTFWTIVASRCIAGALNGNVGVMKSAIADITDHTNLAQAFALIPPVFSVGASIAYVSLHAVHFNAQIRMFRPLYGGALAKPHDHWPALFSGIFFQKYPYFLPCLISALFTAVAFLIAAVFLKESLPPRRNKKHLQLKASLADSHGGIDDDNISPVPIRTLMKTYSVVLPIANYGALSLVDIGFFALVPLFYATPIEVGGLGLSPTIIGTCLALWGLLNGLFQILLVNKLIDHFGEKKLFCNAILAFFPLIAVFPIMSLVVRSQEKVGPVIWVLMILQLFCMVIVNMSYWRSTSGVISVLVTRATPNKYSLGAMNGLSQSTCSIARAIGPATFSSLFAFSKERNILNGNLVYGVLLVLACFLVFLSRFLPDLTNGDDEGNRDTPGETFSHDVA